MDRETWGDLTRMRRQSAAAAAGQVVLGVGGGAVWLGLSHVAASRA